MLFTSVADAKSDPVPPDAFGGTPHSLEVHKRPAAIGVGAKTPAITLLTGIVLMVVAGMLWVLPRYEVAGYKGIDEPKWLQIFLRSGISLVVAGIVYRLTWPGNLQSERHLWRLLTWQRPLGDNPKIDDPFVGKGSGYKRFVRACDLHGVQIFVAVSSIIVLTFEIFILPLILEECGLHGEDSGAAKVWHHAMAELGIALGVASLVSYIFDVSYHERTFGEPLNDMKHQVDQLGGTAKGLNDSVGTLETTTNAVVDSVQGLGDTTNTVVSSVEKFDATLAHLKEVVDSIGNLMGFFNYREKIRASYRRASNRIVSVADYWMIDEKWWSGTDRSKVWDDSELFKSLVEGPAAGSTRAAWPKEIVFAGKVPWPKVVEKDNGEISIRQEDLLAAQVNEVEKDNNGISTTLDPVDFERFLGVAWRLVIASKVRQVAKNSGNQSPCLVEVFVARVPLAATIVDEQVFLLLEEPAELTLSRGTELTGHQDPRDAMGTTRRDRNIADSYDTLVKGYLHHARSAREYIETILCLAMPAASLVVDSPLNRPNIERCLEALGMDDWVRWEKDNPRTRGYMQGIDEDDLKNYALDIIETYIKTLTYLPKQPTFAAFVDDLF